MSDERPESAEENGNSSPASSAEDASVPSTRGSLKDPLSTDANSKSSTEDHGAAPPREDWDESELVPDDEVLNYPRPETSTSAEDGSLSAKNQKEKQAAARGDELPHGNANDSDSELLPGSTFARRYRIEEKLGEGASGTVFRATHELMRKTVAIKLLHADLIGDKERVERFRREAQATAAIDHPNVCGATDIDRLEDGRLYMVMEYLEGRTLTRRLEEAGSLDFGEAIEIVDQVAAALERAHQLNIVHRDLKPDNIYLVDEADGSTHVKILDFGLARVSFPEDVSVLTLPGMVAGTPKYFSPEQCNGETVDGRSDLYTLGLVFYQLVTGSPPFTSSDVRTVMNQHINERPPPASTVAERLIPFAVERLIEKLLRKDPDERIQSAGELRHELSRIDLVADGNVSSSPSLISSSGAQADSDTRKYIVAGAAVLLLVAIMAVAIVVGTGENHESVDAETSGADNYTQQEIEEAARRYTKTASQKDRAILVDNMSPKLATAIADAVIAAPANQYAQQRILVRALLKETGALETLDEWRQLGVRLRATDAGDCAARKPVVREIHKLGDPRLLPTLEKLADSDLDNTCMERTLPRAIGVLRTAENEPAE